MEMAPIQISSIRYTLLSQIRNAITWIIRFFHQPAVAFRGIRNKYVPAVSYIDLLRTGHPRTAGTSRA